MGVHHLQDAAWEKKLGICTGASNFEKDDDNHSRYEPTSYAVLERLAGSGYISGESVLVDYGCGKGRVGFYLNHALGCRTVGVEYNPQMFAAAQDNLARFAGKRRGSVSFVCANAEEFVPDGCDCFYFFNPFSVKILQSVLGKILESWYAVPRRMHLFFYYALDEYLAYLMTRDELEFAGEIDCRDLFPGVDFRERILVFRLG